MTDGQYDVSYSGSDVVDSAAETLPQLNYIYQVKKIATFRLGPQHNYQNFCIKLVTVKHLEHQKWDIYIRQFAIFCIV